MKIIAVQDEDHILADDGIQWRPLRRAGKVWAVDAYCVTLSGLRLFLTRRWSQQRDNGWMPLHHWPVPPSLPRLHVFQRP